VPEETGWWWQVVPRGIWPLALYLRHQHWSGRVSSPWAWAAPAL